MTRETTCCDHMAHDRKGQNSSYSAPLSSGMDRWAIAMAISLSALTVMLLALATQASSWAKPPGSEGAAVALFHVLRIFLGWPAVIGGWTVPMWLSWSGLVVAGALK